MMNSDDDKKEENNDDNEFPTNPKAFCIGCIRKNTISMTITGIIITIIINSGIHFDGIGILLIIFD
jgi:hypothetical protein